MFRRPCFGVKLTLSHWEQRFYALKSLYIMEDE